ncbi:MAG: hypothetical protein R3C53_17465 [Pirellulaceae bacterium]
MMKQRLLWATFTQGLGALIIWQFLVLSALAQAPAVLDDEAIIPPARKTYMGRRIADTSGGPAWLIRPTREDEERPSEVMKQLGLKPGMVVCDMGCGKRLLFVDDGQTSRARGQGLGCRHPAGNAPLVTTTRQRARRR